MKILKYVYNILSYFPLIWILSFIAFIIRARIALGERFPTAYHPDPKDLDFTFHHNFIWLSFFSLLYLILPIWIIIVVLIKWKKYDYINFKLNMIIFLSSCLIIVGILIFDPGDFANWFAD